MNEVIKQFFKDEPNVSVLVYEGVTYMNPDLKHEACDCEDCLAGNSSGIKIDINKLPSLASAGWHYDPEVKISDENKTILSDMWTIDLREKKSE